MKINRTKSGVIFHMMRGRKNIPEDETIFGYPVKENYKYLGIYMDQNMKLNYQLKEVKKKIEKGKKMIQIMQWKGIEQ